MEPDELDLLDEVEFLESQLYAAGRPVNHVMANHISQQISSTTDASERLNYKIKETSMLLKKCSWLQDLEEIFQMT